MNKQKKNLNYPPRCGVVRFEARGGMGPAFGSKCPRSILGVLIAIAESRSEGALNVRGNEQTKRNVAAAAKVVMAAATAVTAATTAVTPAATDVTATTAAVTATALWPPQ